MRKLIVLALIATFYISCTPKKESIDREKVKQEVIQAEHDFGRAAKEKGVEAAFLEFAADNAVINRGEKIYKGKEEMKAFFSRSTLTNVELTWEPEFVDVSTDGTLAYTYGPYTFKAMDKDGNPLSAEGLFHTVWKRQADGNWRFVYD